MKVLRYLESTFKSNTQHSTSSRDDNDLLSRWPDFHFHVLAGCASMMARLQRKHRIWKCRFKLHSDPRSFATATRKPDRISQNKAKVQWLQKVTSRAVCGLGKQSQTGGMASLLLPSWLLGRHALHVSVDCLAAKMMQIPGPSRLLESTLWNAAFFETQYIVDNQLRLHSWLNCALLTLDLNSSPSNDT